MLLTQTSFKNNLVFSKLASFAIMAIWASFAIMAIMASFYLYLSLL
jgi:hypothetical protein